MARFARQTERSGGQKGRGLGGRNFCPPSLSAAAEFRISLCEMRRQEEFYSQVHLIDIFAALRKRHYRQILNIRIFGLTCYKCKNTSNRLGTQHRWSFSICDFVPSLQLLFIPKIRIYHSWGNGHYLYVMWL